MVHIDRETIFKRIEEERERQEDIHPMPRRKNIKDNDVNAIANIILCSEFLSVLVEEVGEVGKAMQGDGNLEEELIQVASVCVRILEYLK